MMSQRFRRRMGCAFIVFSVIAFFIFASVSLWILKIVNLNFLSKNNEWIYPLSIIVLGFLIFFLTHTIRRLRHLSEPFSNLLEAAEQIAEGDYSSRVSESGPMEVRVLGRAFNSMASRLQTHDEQRRNMFADISHELRTPLAVIQGNIEGMIDGVYPADEARLKSIFEETQTLTRLVEDMRTFALSESGALQLKKELVNLGVLISESLLAFQEQADSKKISINLDIPSDTPSIHLDPLRIKEVLFNLMTNALRYSPQNGEVHVSLSFDDANARVAITDSGTGIAPEDLPRIFERFYKSHDSGGMGLGLAIAKNIISAHGGNIRAESVKDKGTKIIFELPVN
jgi:signal transduction histidine kinase